MAPNKAWPHAPIHRLGSDGVYMITGATVHKQLLYSTPAKLTLLENELLTLAKQYNWQLEAWAVFMNHYHLIARGEAYAERLDEYLNHVHSNTARELNSQDNRAARPVWYNYWETRLTYQRSYLARLNYVHQNAVKHGLVSIASQYQWCSAAWFERTATPSAVKTIYGLKSDRVRVYDDY